MFFIKKKSLRTLLLLSMLFFSFCTQEKTEKQSFFDHFKQEGILVIDKQEKAYWFSKKIYFIPKSDKNPTADTLISYYHNAQIVFRKYNDNTSVKSLELASFMEEYQLENILDYYYLNDDTVFVSANRFSTDKGFMEYFILQTDLESNRQQIWNISERLQITDPYLAVISSYRSANNMKYKNGKLYALTDVIAEPFKKYNTKKPPGVLVVDILKDSLYFIYTKPSVYGEGLFYGTHANKHSIAFISDSSFVVSYPIDAKLYEFNIFGEKIAEKQCESFYIEEIKPIEKKERLTAEDMIKAMECHAYYANIIFDTESNLLYRLVYHEQEYLNEEGEKNTSYDRSMSIMVIDENLEVLGEYYIPPYQFKPYLPKVNEQKHLLLELQENNKHHYILQYIYRNNKNTKTE